MTVSVVEKEDILLFPVEYLKLKLEDVPIRILENHSLKPKLIFSAAPQNNKTFELNDFCPSDFFDIPPLQFFSEESIAFLNDLSIFLLRQESIRRYPELMALAFWLRKGNLVTIMKSWKAKISKYEKVFPRGVAFHITPSNVDSIFLYSWALSLLTGNLNLVRVSRSRSRQIEILLEIVEKLYVNHEAIARRNKIFSYDYDDTITSYFSINSDLRIIWGGDETINEIKNLKSKPTTKDITFADKSSLAIINTASYLSLDELSRNELAHAFFNDAYWFNQKACSSPSRVYFVGTQVAEASKIFWKHLGKELIKNNNLDDVSLSMKKLTAIYQEIIDNNDLKPLIIGRYDQPTVLLQESSYAIHPSCGGGFFIEGRLSSLDELPKLLRSKDQTLSYFGFNLETLNEICLNNFSLGLDRIVPMGQALDFFPVWDGYDLLSEFSKRLTLF
ncbi:hypothetical protein OBA18_00915 [Pelagibacteraceae bacterium]|nr:hypothetical protein [Pelagibacteraceae bacterium]